MVDQGAALSACGSVSSPKRHFYSKIVRTLTRIIYNSDPTAACELRRLLVFDRAHLSRSLISSLGLSGQRAVNRLVIASTIEAERLNSSTQQTSFHLSRGVYVHYSDLR